MRWRSDDVRYLERIIISGHIEYALQLLQRFPGLPKDAAADMYRIICQWRPNSPQLRTLREELLRRLSRLKAHDTQQESLLPLFD